MGGGQLINLIECGQRRRDKSDLEEVTQRRAIETWGQLRQGREDRSGFRAKRKATTGFGVMQRLDPESIARQH